jgi:hypothetical protein
MVSPSPQRSGQSVNRLPILANTNKSAEQTVTDVGHTSAFNFHESARIFIGFNYSNSR